MHSQMVQRADVRSAAARLRGRVRETPIMTIDGRDLGVDGAITLKLEYLQHSGTFKARGAMHFMLTNDIVPAGVAAASGGNHGAAVAWAARTLGHRATIFVPTISSPAKVARLRSYGAEVNQVGKVYAEALEACLHHQQATGATGIHAYEAPDVFAGAGTTGLEFENQVRKAGQAELDAVLVACGGGGLAGGIATALPDPNQGGPVVVACETEGTAGYAAARAAGKPVQIEVSGVAADALGASMIGSLAFDALSGAEAESVVVDDDSVRQARILLWDRFRMVVEASAAVPVAALTSGAWKFDGDGHIGIVVCGANTSPSDLDSI